MLASAVPRLISLALLWSEANAFSSRIQPNALTKLTMTKSENEHTLSSRKDFLQSTAFIIATGVGAGLGVGVSPANAVERAVGAAEKVCREEGNCLEKGDWDGAVGWNWGGKDRCDAT